MFHTNYFLSEFIAGLFLIVNLCINGLHLGSVFSSNNFLSRNESYNPDMNRPMGAVLYVPVQPLDWDMVSPESWFHLPIDTIYIQGYEPQIRTIILIEEFLRYGPIVALYRNQNWEEKEKRRSMWIQFASWSAAWFAVRHSHGKMLAGQDLAVEISSRTLCRSKGGEIMFVFNEFYEEDVM